MKYYIVIGHKKGELDENGQSHASDSIEVVERDEIHGQLIDGSYTQEKPGAHQSFGFLDVIFNEGPQYGHRATLTQEAWLIGRHRIARSVDFGNFGYKFVRTGSTTRIQFPDKITLSFDKAIPVDSDREPRRPENNSQRVNIELTHPAEQIINCYDKECAIDPNVFKLAQFDNYGDVYLDIHEPKKYEDFKANLNHFIQFMKDYPNSSLFLVCPPAHYEQEIKDRLRTAITTHHLTNYVEFCNHNFTRRSPFGKGQSGQAFSEYDTFKETIREFFNEDSFKAEQPTNERNFYSVPFKNAKITIDATYPWKRYTESAKFRNFLKYNSNITLEISGDVTPEDVVTFMNKYAIKATLFLSNDPNNATIIKTLAENREKEIKDQIQAHHYDQLLLKEEQVDPIPEPRLMVKKYLAHQAGLEGANDVHDEVNAMGQNQNTQQQQQQQMVTSNNSYYEPLKLEISSKSSIPDVDFEENDALLEQLIGLKFTDSVNAPQIEAHIKHLFGTMQSIIRNSSASRDCYCPLSYSVEELLPGAFYVPKAKIATIDHPRYSSVKFNEQKNTLFFSPPYASIAIKKDKYAFKPFYRPVDERLSPSEVLSETIKNDKFVIDLVSNYRDDAALAIDPQSPAVDPTISRVTEKQQIYALLNQLLLNRGEAAVRLFTRSLYSLKLKNPSVYNTLVRNYILTSRDLSEFIDNQHYVSTLSNLATLKDLKKIAWWNKIVDIQCKTNPNFDLNHLYRQFTSFWEDLDKLQNFLTIPDEFPFDDFADAGITLGKMYRIMANAKNRFEQMNDFHGGNISHAYMLFDLFNASMYSKEMDEYCVVLNTQLKAEDAFNRSNLKETYFSLRKVIQLTNDPVVSLDQLKSYLFIYAAVNSNIEKQNNSDIGFYRSLFTTIEAESKELSPEDKKIIFSTIMLFSSYGNNISISNSEQDVKLFLRQPGIIATCKGILGQYNKPERNQFFVAQDGNGKMINSEAMLSFRTVAALTSKNVDNAQQIMNQAQAWIMNNKALSPALQKIMRESPTAARVIATFNSQPEYLKEQPYPNAGLIQSIFLIAADLDSTITGYTESVFNSYKQMLSACNKEQLEFLNKLFLDISCDAIGDCTLFSDRSDFKQFIQKAQKKSTLDDFIFLAQDSKVPLRTIKASEAGLLKQIKQIENSADSTRHIAQYRNYYSDYSQRQLCAKLGDPSFSDRLIIKIDINNDFQQLKGCYESLNNIIKTTKKDDLLNVEKLLTDFEIGSVSGRVHPFYLLQVTDLLLRHLYPIENIEHFLQTTRIQSDGNNQKINDKFHYLHYMFERIAQTPECYEAPSSKKKLSKNVVQQLKACLKLLNKISGENLVQLVKDNNNIQNYLQFIAVAASADNIHTPNFYENNRRWNELNKTHPSAFTDLLDITKFDITLLSAIQFSSLEQIRFVAKICRNELSLNLRKEEPLDKDYKQKFIEDLKTLLGKNLKLDPFYDDKQLSQPSIASLLKLLSHYNNDVKKAHHHYEKDPSFNRPHKKTNIAGTPAVAEKTAHYRTNAFSTEQQNNAIDFIAMQFNGIERSVRKNMLFKFSEYTNDLGYKIRAFSHQGSGGQMTMVPLRKLSDVELKTAFLVVKQQVATFTNKGAHTIWENREYQRNVSKLLAIIRESMFRYGNKNAYSTQMNAILLAVMAGDYSYAMQINTGEGKALITASIAIALQTLTNKQIVITTSNMNLAERDAEAFDKFIKWFDIPHATISARTEEKGKLTEARIVHTTGSDFALCHGKVKKIDNSDRIYLNDEGDYTMSHLTPAINSQSKPDELENWWIYEEILDYVVQMNPLDLRKDSEQQTQDLIARLKDKFNTRLRDFNTEKAIELNAIQASSQSEDNKLNARLAVEERLNGPISTLMKRIALLDKETTPDYFSGLIDSAIIAQFVFKRGASYEIIDHVEDGKKVNKVVPVEGGKPIIENEVMYMYGIHQFLIQKEILEYRARAAKDNSFPHSLEFLQPPALESTTYFNNYSTQVGGKSIGFSGTIPKLKYQIYQSIMDEGRSHVIPHHKNNQRIDAVPYEKFVDMKEGHNNVCKDEKILVGRLVNAIQAHDGPVLVYCKDKNECEKRLKKLHAKLDNSEYTVQLIINGITQDFTDGDKLTARGRIAQKKKTVTLTVGDGRGIDIKPEGADGLLSICSFAPENVEKILQIYGRAARDGKVGKTNLFILESELQCYGKKFDNLEAKFEFLDKVRAREFDFAIKKIGFIQYEVQQKIKDETKRIEMIDYMDNVYNKLILKAVVANVNHAKKHRIGGQEIQGRWEPFVMLNDDDLAAVYREFCDLSQLELGKKKLDDIDIKQIDKTKEKYKKQTEEAKQKEIDAQKGRSSAYVEDRIQAAIKKKEPNIPLQPRDTAISNPNDKSQYKKFELNLLRLDETISLMEQFVDSHIGVYGVKGARAQTPEYKKICETLDKYKQQIMSLKQEKTTLFSGYLARRECLNAVNLMLEDPSKQSDRSLSAIEQSCANLDYCDLNFCGQNETIKSVKQAIANYLQQDSLDANAKGELQRLQSTLSNEISQLKLDDDITRDCDRMYQIFQNEFNECHHAALEKLAEGLLDPVELDATPLYSMLHMATGTERKTAEVRAIIDPVSAEVNPDIQKYNTLARQYHEIVREQFLCQSYLGLNREQTKAKAIQYKEMGIFDADSKTVFVYYQNKAKALKDAPQLKISVPQEQAELDRLKKLVSVQAQKKLEEYQQLFVEFEAMIEEKSQCQRDQNQPTEPPETLNKYRKFLTLDLNAKNMIQQLRRLDFATSSLKRDIIEQGGIVAVLRNKPFYDKFKAKVALLDKKMTDFAKGAPHEHRGAYDSVSILRAELLNAGKEYFTKLPTIERFNMFKAACKDSINAARKGSDHGRVREGLDRHRGWKKILANILAFILTAGIGYAIAAGINFAIHRKQTFWSTDTSLRMDKIDECVDKDVPAPGAP